MITVKHLSKSYQLGMRGTRLALNNVSFSASAGQITGLLGLNGAGKTTCLRILSTALSADKGQVFLGDESSTLSSALARRKLGFFSSKTQLQGRLTAREELQSYADYFRLDHGLQSDYVSELFDQFQVRGFLDQKLDTLSLGQSQRISLVRVMLHDPAVLILDEPTTGLDVASAKLFLNAMQQARTQGKTILFSTHNLHEVEALCDHLVILAQGQCVYEGDRASCLSQYDNLESAFLSYAQPRGVGETQ